MAHPSNPDPDDTVFHSASAPLVGLTVAVDIDMQHLTIWQSAEPDTRLTLTVDQVQVLQALLYKEVERIGAFQMMLETMNHGDTEGTNV